MATVQEKIDQLLSNMSGGSEEDRLKMLLYYGDLSEEFADDDDWAALCEFALEADEELGTSTPYLEQYSALVKEQKFPEALSAMLYDLRDNRILAAMAIHRAGLPNQMQLVAAAAYNKQNYQGLKDEFAVTRFLVWSGFDVNVPDPSTGMTALHMFASTNVMPGSHPRAVRWLIEHGADVDAVNENGDTPLAFLCGKQGWGETQDQSFELLMEAGANPFVRSKDGQSPMGLLAQMNAQERSELRTARLDQIRDLSKRLEQERISEEGGAGEADQNEGEESEPARARARGLAQLLLTIKSRVDEIRAFYCNEEAIERNRQDAGEQAWDASDGEQYLKRVYQMTMGLAIRNSLFCRLEFYSKEVSEVFKEDRDFAFLFDPSHVLPLMDCFREEFASKVFLGLARPDQEQFAKEALSVWKDSPRVRELVTFRAGDEDGDEGGDAPELNELLIGGLFQSLERRGFGTVARMASFLHLSMLFGSGWGNPFMGVRSEGVEIPNALSTRIAIHVINRRKVRDGVEGRALGFALQSFCMQVSQGLLSGPLINAQMLVDAPEDYCCDALGADCCLLPVIWGLSDKPYPKGADVEQGKIEVPEELQAIMSALQKHVMASDEPSEEERTDSVDDVAVEPEVGSEPESEPVSANPVQAEQAKQPIPLAEPSAQAAAPSPMDWDALMKLQGVAWGNDGKAVKVSMGDK